MWRWFKWWWVKRFCTIYVFRKIKLSSKKIVAATQILIIYNCSYCTKKSLKIFNRICLNIIKIHTIQKYYCLKSSIIDYLEDIVILFTILELYLVYFANFLILTRNILFISTRKKIEFKSFFHFKDFPTRDSSLDSSSWGGFNYPIVEAFEAIHSTVSVEMIRFLPHCQTVLAWIIQRKIYSIFASFCYFWDMKFRFIRRRENKRWIWILATLF